MRQSRSVRTLLGLAMLASLAGCESGARQDPLGVRGSTDDIVFANNPIFRDRTIHQTIVTSLELTDYAVALRQAGLLSLLRENGPFTVFAVPNAPLEAEQRARDDKLVFSPTHHAELRRLMAYTIVRGRYTQAKLRQLIAKRQGPIGLATLDGHDVLTVSRDKVTGALLLSDQQGRVNRLWLADVPQSNGVLYATQSLLVPRDTVVAAASRR